MCKLAPSNVLTFSNVPLPPSSSSSSSILLPAESSLMERDIPITIYSAKPVIHPMSAPTGTNPFGKDSGFSMPIDQYNRSVTKDL